MKKFNENNLTNIDIMTKAKRRVTVQNFGNNPKSALKLLADEKKAREAVRKKYEKNKEIMNEAE